MNNVVQRRDLNVCSSSCLYDCVTVCVSTCDSDLDLAIGAPKCVRGSIFRTAEHNRGGRVYERRENTEMPDESTSLHAYIVFFRVINTTESTQAKRRKTKRKCSALKIHRTTCVCGGLYVRILGCVYIFECVVCVCDSNRSCRQ